MNPKVATAIVVLALVIMAGVPARTDASSTYQPQTNLSSLPKIEAYLDSIGVDIDSVVVQQGQLNYAGPTCPGAVWNCTTASMVVQMTTSRSLAANIFDCLPTANATIPALNECVIVQSSVLGLEPTGTTNEAFCGPDTFEGPYKSKCKIKQSSKKGNNYAEVRARATQKGGSPQSATQTAEITQESESGNNTAKITQEITQSMVQGSQAASQDAIVNQMSDSGTNNLAVSQLIKQNQSTAFAGPSVTQDQEAHQTIRACQGGAPDPCANTTASPRNISGVAQKNLQSTTVRFDEGDSGTIIQEQNAQTSGGPSSQTLVRQNSQDKANDAELNQFGRATALVLNHKDHDDDDNGNGTDGFSGFVTQRQGNGTSPCTNSGLCGFEFQDSTGVQKAFESQDEALRMRAPNETLTLTLTQVQHGPFYCCATQTGGNNENVNEILQTKSVLASGTVQTAYVQAHCDSPSGVGDMDNCTAKQFVTVQGEAQEPNTCTDRPSCNIVTSCESGESCQQLEEVPQPPCPPDQECGPIVLRAGAVIWRDDGPVTT
jgi:hypothetical protein